MKLRFSSSLLALLFISTLLLPSASALVSTPTEADYQAIVDKVNKELGTNIKLATPAEIAKLKAIGFPIKDRPSSLVEFENEIRSTAIKELKATAEAKQEDVKIALLSSEKTIIRNCTYRLELSTSDSNIDTRTVTQKTALQSNGGKGHIKATITNAANYWAYGTILDAWISWSQSDGYPIFYTDDTINLSFIDARRTCYARYTGMTYDAYGNLISSSAYRYAYFYAQDAV